MNIFANKETFKSHYEQKMKSMYRVNLRDAGLFQKYSVLATLLDQSLNEDYQNTLKTISQKNMRKTIYFSMEFLMGRMVTNNLQNSGHHQLVKEVFEEWGWDLNEIEERESDTGLGNGGLGRLAACFLDSSASTNLPVFGNSLRYKHGFFVQEIVNHKQVEHPDPWLDEPFYWETRKDKEALHIPFFGYVENTKLINPIYVKAVPYDVKIVGDTNGVVNHLRLWKTEPSELHHHRDHGYNLMVEKISDSLYPDDSNHAGKTLRLQQQYLFSAAGVKSAINEHIYLGRDISVFHEFYRFQLNDTHPAVVIPELMRVLMDDYGLGYDESWHITTNTCAFTNHTILSEALEKWDIHIFRNLLPRVYEIIGEMNRRFKAELRADGRYNEDKIYLMSLIGNNTVRMANISMYGAYSINGVAALHTDILKNIEMKDFYQLYPHKFNNKTNGITHRRWLIHSNPELSTILDKHIGNKWRKDLELISDFKKFAQDDKVQKQVDKMKLTKKKALAHRIYQEQGIELDPNSIFDIQVKRLHEYKRQLLNILHIIYVYQRLKSDPKFKESYYPHSFIFGAKSAPSYNMAKAIIELINSVADIVNRDRDTNKLLKVVFVRNYNVTYAEYIMPAADLSEQISTASKEASGTGNMKFMLNGAITIGTLDGANVEIAENAGDDNVIIFGLNAKEVTDIYKTNGYKPREIFSKDKRLQDVFEFVRNLTNNPHHFDYILSNLLNSDYFMVLKDFDSYVKAHEKANLWYQDRKGWLEKSINNIASAGFFSSDRTISQYNKDIWHLDKINFK